MTHDLLGSLPRFITRSDGEEEVKCWLFDADALDPDRWSEFLEDTFCDGFIDGYLDDGEAGPEWNHPVLTPVGLNNWQGDEDGDPLDGQFDQLLLLARSGEFAGQLYAIDVDGTAMPESEPTALGLQVGEL